MKAVILAAGEGTRLRPFTETMPKVMLPVANKPIIQYLIEAIINSGIEEIIIVVGYKKEIILKYFEDYEEVKINYVVQKNQLGTAHALMQAKDMVTDDFIVLAGDNIVDHSSINKILKIDSEYAVLTKEHGDPSKYGAVSLDKNFLKGIVEKPNVEDHSLISTGVYKLPKGVFTTIEKIASEGEYSLSTSINQLIKQGVKIAAVKADLWMDIVYPWDIIYTNETILGNQPHSIGGYIEKGVTLRGSVAIGKGSRIYGGSYIVGPVNIGENCEIGPNSCIYPCTTIGDNTSIYSNTEIRNSVIMNDVHIGSSSYIEQSIIGRGTIIKNNFSTISGENLIKIEEDYKSIDHIGAMIGQDCDIGSHVVLGPGIIVGRKCSIAPLNHIFKNLPSESQVM
ncbi:MAG: NTP transferase domain-containing protein [Candidatus Thermoplasmatota archaeon]|nr:NTP transferase domain-containing protein [Candidatus Thermoplasmatota archaeon]